MNKFKKLSKKEKAEYIALIALYPLMMLFAQLGKVCKLFGTKRRQITASILCAAIVFTMLPVMSLTAFAAEPAPTPTPLTFTAQADGSTVTFEYATGDDVKYKKNDGAWTDCPSGTSIALENIGDTVSFRGTDVVTYNGSNFTMTGKIAASGDVTSLTNRVGGDATLTIGCYYAMFLECTSLTTAPALPATTLANNCYQSMFDGCTNLTTAPEQLPATALNYKCYQYMFKGCTSLTAAPKLPATALAYYCYDSMFEGCTNLTTAPALPATTLADYCYHSMFKDCTSLKISTTNEGNYTKAWSIPSAGTITTTATCWNTSMLSGTGGTFTGNPAKETIYYIYEEPTTPLTFTAQADGSTVTFKYATGDDVKYKKNDGAWTDCPSGTSVALENISDTVSFRGTGVTTDFSNHFTMTGSLAASGDVTSLTNGVGGDTTLMAYCYNYMFYDCISLTTAPQLPTTTLPTACYSNMFRGCTGLTEAPELPATTLATHCYYSMFYDCESLKSAPKLPATTLASSCYQYMLYGCASLKISTTKEGNYTKEWRISTTDDITETATDWNTKMLFGTGGTFIGDPVLNTTYYLYEEPTIPLTFTAETAGSTVTLNYASGSDVKYKTGSGDWVDYVAGTAIPLANKNDTVSFMGTNVVTNARKHFSMTGSLAASGDVTSLTNGVGGDATLMASCYNNMFLYCTSLTAAPALPATTLADSCYSSMFFGCTSLKAAPGLSATTLADSCYASMFKGCTALTTAPELPAIALSRNCYANMFEGCNSLTTAPALPAKELAVLCYASMFNGCTALTTAPKLPATTLDINCYINMFRACTALTAAPELPAKELADSCYSSMFYGCTALTTAPELPATTLADSCYKDMFYDCTGLKVSATKTDNYTKAWSIPTTGTISATAYNWNYYMLLGTGGTFTGDPTENTTYYIYEGPTLTFTAQADDSSVTLNYKSGSNVKYKLGDGEWTDYLLGTSITLAKVNDTVSFKGTGVTTDSENHFTMTGKIAASGNVTSLTNGVGGDAAMAEYCYRYMFDSCTSLTAAPELPAKALADGCYSNMFNGCTGLTTAPALPATTMADSCYRNMFYGCTSLTTAPALPATTMANSCYHRMFQGCTSLTAAPKLPATTLDDCCYLSMFQGCTSLTAAPELPAKALADSCYSNMFYGCTGLTTAPALNATTLAGFCYCYMFQGCTSLAAAPDLPAKALVDGCYYAMFDGCTSLKISTTNEGNYTKAWSIPSAGTITTTASEWNIDMLAGTGGTFTGAPTENTTYYVYVDTTAPAVSGIENGKTYCETAEFTVTDADIDTVTVNENALTAVNGKYTLTAAGTYNVVATDKSGNKTTITVTLNADHTWETEWLSDGTNHWHECSVCGEKKDSAAHTPDADDGDCTTPICCAVCSAVTTAAEDNHDFDGTYEYDGTYHWHICKNNGCTKTNGEEAHTGGTATYFDKAVCTACGQEYGTTTPDVTAPTNLKIQYNSNGFKAFLNTTTFGIFFKETVDVTASAEDSESDIAGYQYLASDTQITDFTSVSWQNSLSLTPNSKKIVYVKATDKAGNSSVINYEGVVVYSDSTISPATATFDKNVDNQADIEFTMTLNDNTLKDIKNGTTALTRGTDYTVSGNTVTVKKAYFAAQENGDVALDFFFYPMDVKNNENLSIATTTVTVSDTTHYHSLTAVNAKAATCTENGNEEYWHCSRCNKNFSNENGNVEITLEDTVLMALGHNFTNYVYNNDATYYEDGTETATCNHDGCSVTDTRTVANTKLIDTTAPTGEIKISNSSFKSFVNSITFGLFFMNSQTVTITCADDGIGLDKIYYTKSETELSLDTVKALSADKWTEGSTLTISPDWKGVVYAKITDKSGNTLCISSDGLVFDATSPVIAGVTDGGKYCNTATVQVTVTEENLDHVTLDGVAVTLTDGKFTVSAKDSVQKIVVTDKAGNENAATITVYADHVWNSGAVTTEPTTTDKGVKTYTCSVCRETKAEEIPMLAPSITEGENASYTEGENAGLTFKSNASLANLESVSVDGIVIDKTNYTTAEGSTVVTLTADYLATLSVGTHTLAINSTSGVASTEFTIAAKPTDTSRPADTSKPTGNSNSGDTQSPQTEDSSNIVFWFALLFISGGALTAHGITKKRKKATNK